MMTLAVNKLGELIVCETLARTVGSCNVFPTISLTFHAFALRIEPQLLVSRHPGHMKHGSTTHQLVRHKNALRSEDA